MGYLKPWGPGPWPTWPMP